MHSYTVIDHLELPHCVEGEHEAFGPDGVSLGMRPCEHAKVAYAPGQTAFLTETQLQELLAAGRVAAAGVENVEELIAIALCIGWA